MKYSEKLVWRSVYEFVPGFKTAVENGVDINLPSALKQAAETAFLEIGDNSIASLGWERGYAAYVIQDALKECSSVGWMTFGTQEGYWE